MRSEVPGVNGTTPPPMQYASPAVTRLNSGRWELAVLGVRSTPRLRRGWEVVRGPCGMSEPVSKWQRNRWCRVRGKELSHSPLPRHEGHTAPR